MDLNNIVGFKAIDADGNEQNVTVDEMVDMVSTRMVMALSETSTFAAAAAVGNDVYENELPTVTDAANVRVLQSSGDAAQMTMQSLASKLGELLPTNGIKRTEYYETIRLGVSFSIGAPTNEFVYVSHNDGEMMIYVDSTGIVTKIFSSADKIISISLKDNQIMITAINYDLIVTIRVLSF
ncbi:hypothetical protein [Bacteroides sp.]|uniref:hypothetical protein n=1 Tax=Bacteroides sp. TaxID=29523 RepID=UPI00258931AC|nr:hypothetical protein [Bacteroides sp.]